MSLRIKSPFKELLGKISKQINKMRTYRILVFKIKRNNPFKLKLYRKNKNHRINKLMDSKIPLRKHSKSILR